MLNAPFARVICGLLVLAAPLAVAKDTWLYAKTDHFEMYSSASQRESRDLLVKLEQFRAFFLGSFSLRRAREPRTFVIVFGSDRAFKPYKPLYKGRPKEVTGIFVRYPDEALMALTTDIDPDVGEYEEFGATVLHEYVHFLLSTRGMKPPLWLNEGLAEFFSTFRLREDTVEIGLPNEILVSTLQSSSLVPLDKLVAATGRSAAPNDETQAPYFYAESWALTHYLMCGADRSNGAKLVEYLARADNIPPRDAQAIFEKTFGVSYQQMQINLRAYLDGGRYYSRASKLPIADESAKIAFRRATDFEAEVMLADLKWRVRRHESATADMLRLAAQQPMASRPQELLAAIHAEEDRKADAVAHWRKAVERHSDTPYVYVALAREALGDVSLEASIDKPPLAAATAAELRTWLDRALSISPDSADVLEMVAITEALAPTIRGEAINRVQAGFRGIRDPQRTLLALAIVRYRLDDPATARAMATAIVDDRNAEDDVRKAARELMQRLPAGPAKPTDAASAGK